MLSRGGVWKTVMMFIITLNNDILPSSPEHAHAYGDPDVYITRSTQLVLYYTIFYIEAIIILN